MSPGTGKPSIVFYTYNIQKTAVRTRAERQRLCCVDKMVITFPELTEKTPKPGFLYEYEIKGVNCHMLKTNFLLRPVIVISFVNQAKKIPMQ